MNYLALICLLSSLNVGLAKDCANTLVIFGAGYEDNGVSAPNDLYGLHKYSTGKVWPEYLADALDYDLQDYAVAGANTGQETIFFHNWGGIQWQVDTYLRRFNSRVPQNHLIGLATGAVNEMFVMPYTEAVFQRMVDNITIALERLGNAGAKNVFVMNLVDYTSVPAFQTSNQPQIEDLSNIPQRKAAILNHNEKFSRMLTSVTRRYPNTKWVPIDYYRIFEEAIRKFPYQTVWAFNYGSGTALPQDLYARDVAQPDDLLKYSFYDGYHPASGPHLEMSKAIHNQLKQSRVVKSW